LLIHCVEPVYLKSVDIGAGSDALSVYSLPVVATMNLLIIDDDEVDRLNIQLTLKASSHHFSVTEASNAHDGLRMLQNNEFDLVLLDYQLPEQTGLEVLQKMNKCVDIQVAVVILSHIVDDHLALRCIKEGAQDYIPKNEVTPVRLMRAMLHARERFTLEQKLRNSYSHIRRIAEIDYLTGLANRHIFESGLSGALPRARRQGTSVALIMMDLDKFKHINDTMGHQAGDQMLRDVALRLSKQVREGDILCRLGGDEFAVLVQNIEDLNMLQLLIKRLKAAFSEPYLVDEHKWQVSVSMGIATYPESAVTAEQLMKCADVALYRAKENGRGRSHFYSKALHKKIVARIELERDLANALANQELELYYQPQINTLSENVIGMEALIRWHHPTRGLVLPNDFISIAEESGIIDEIGLWTVKTACNQLRVWKDKYPALDGKMSVAINLSYKQLSHSNLVSVFKDQIARCKLAPDEIELELTESCLHENPEACVVILKQLAEIGVHLALDDFGTGYSSLLQLQQFPFDVLKIDKSFVQAHSQQQKILLGAIGSFAHTLGLTTVAEGVETSDQIKLCQELKFDRIQGFFYDTPMPAIQAELLFSHNQSGARRH